jgi:hypothetical protein
MVGKQSGKALVFSKMWMGAAITKVVSLGRCRSRQGREEGGGDAGKGHLFSLLLLNFSLTDFLFFLFTGEAFCLPENVPPDKL